MVAHSRVLRWVQSQREKRLKQACALPWGVKNEETAEKAQTRARRSREAEHDTRRHRVGMLRSTQSTVNKRCPHAALPHSTALSYPFRRRANAPRAVNNNAICTDLVRHGWHR